MENICKHLMVSLLHNNIIRFEYSPNDKFTTNESLLIKNKKPLDKEIEISLKKGVCSFEYLGLHFEFLEEDPIKSLSVRKGNKNLYAYREIKNTVVLPPSNKIPAIYPIIDSPRVTLSNDGFVPGSEGFDVDKDIIDLYLLITDSSYVTLKKQIISLIGKSELPNAKLFGYISSKEGKFNQKATLDEIKKHEANNSLADVFVFDINSKEEFESLFPNVEEVSRYAHKRNKTVIFSNKLESLKDNEKVFDDSFIERQSNSFTKLYSKGVDGVFNKTNNKKTYISKSMPNSMLSSYVFEDLTKQFHLGFTLDPEVYERTALISNYHNELGQRGIVRSSETKVTPWSLRNEIVKLGESNKNLVPYYSVDIGAASGEISKREFLRFVEFGAFSPIFRMHTSMNENFAREISIFDKNTNEIAENFLKMRYALLPEIYTAAYKNYELDEAICKPLYLAHPDDKKCYKEDTSYIINDSILVSPLADIEKPHSIKKSNIHKKLKLTITPVMKGKGSKSFSAEVKSFLGYKNLFKDAKKAYKNVKEFAFTFKGEVIFKSETTLAIKNLISARLRVNGKVVFDDLEKHRENFTEILKLKRNKHYRIELEYVMPRRAKVVEPLVYSETKKKKVGVYLPEGEWFNIFHRNVYQGKRYVKEKFKVDEMPVFVKAGSLLALNKKISNISNMSLKSIIYDYYTSKLNTVEDYFYEDDGKTTAYKIGEYRKNYFKTSFEKDRYVVLLKGSAKLLEDEIKVREVFFKAHIRDNETIEKVLLNGEEIRFKRHDHLKRALPFLDAKFAKDSKTLSFKFRQVIKNDYKIELVIKQK